MRRLLHIRRPTKRRMAALLALPALSAMAAATVTAAQPANADDLTVAKTNLKAMTWNIHGGESGPRDIAEMAQLVNSHDVNVLTVQEIHRAPGRDQVKKLANELGWYTADLSENTHFSRGDRPGPCDAEQSGWAGNAVLSKFPIEERVTIRLSPEGQDCPVKRVMAGVKLDLPGNDYVRVFTSHFTAGESQAATDYRQAQAMRVLKYLRHEGPLLFTADVNARPSGRIHGWFLDKGWFDTGGAYADEPTRRNGGRIDYIFAKDVSVSGGYVIDSTLSDHRPLVMRMRVN